MAQVIVILCIVRLSCRVYVAVVLARSICFCAVYVTPIVLVCCVTNMPANLISALLRILWYVFFGSFFSVRTD
jgi:hypothetical protein